MNMDYYNSLDKALLRLAHVSEEDLRHMHFIFHLRKLGKNEFFVHEGSVPRTVGFIISGLVRFFFINESGEEFNRGFSVESDFIASYSALLAQEISPFSIQALEDTILLEAYYNELEPLLRKSSALQMIEKKIVDSLFLKKQKRETLLLSEDATGRYKRFLEDDPSLESRISLYHIASYLGITNVSLSRIRKKLSGQ